MENIANTEWTLASIVTLPARFVLGWILWGGATRRFIYDPEKLNPHASHWMANKLQSAIPGAILGASHIISFIVLHFYLLYFTMIIFSLAELFCGLAILSGFLTRLAAFISLLISIILMVSFGWQGATCLDEWTMAATTLALSGTLMLSGASYYSLDHLIMKDYPNIEKRQWFYFLASGPAPKKLFKWLTIFLMSFTIIFVLLTYNYYRGSIFTPYHNGPVGSEGHYLALSQGTIDKNGEVTFQIYVDSGTPAIPANIIRIELVNNRNEILENWNAKALSVIPAKNIQNIYAYNKVTTGPYGLVAPLSAKAYVSLRLKNVPSPDQDPLKLIIFGINGDRFEVVLRHTID